MKNKILTLSIVVVLGICALGATNAFATATPHIFYSDLTAGPNTGGQNNNGVFVTIWGNNFGTTQGASYITVGGGKVNNYPTWTNTEISFQLGANTATGNIVLVTSNGSATGPSFTVQAGNIYFVNPAATTNGTGTYASPFNHIYYFNNIANPGDTVYVEAGTIYDEVDGIDGWHSMLEPISNGNQGSPISYIAYPNATVNLEVDGGTATWTRGAAGGDDNVEYIFRQGAANDSDWQTISKFTMILTTANTISAISSSGANGWKMVGNNITAQFNPNNGMINIGGNYTQALGNEIHNVVLSPANNEAHSIYWNGGGSNVEIGWNYMHDNNGVGWEIQTYHAGLRNGIIHNNLIICAPGNIARGINIGDVDGGEDRTGTENSVYDIYNNIVVGAGDDLYYGDLILTDGTAYVYNNTFYKNNGSVNGVVLITNTGDYGPGGGNPVWYFADNIIVSTSGTPYIANQNGGTPPALFSLITNNLYYGNGNGPSIDTNPINGNPEFVNAAVSDTADFHLQSTSAAINAGYNTSSIVTTDYDGNPRPLNGAVSIGAYQYGSSSLLPSLPVVAITSSNSGSSVTAGSNITITASASETNGSISSVSFYNGTTLLGTDTTSPYSYTWANVPAGIYILTAKATDANGISTTSSALTITVTAPPVLPSSPVVTITNPNNGSTYTAGSNATITTIASETNGTIRNIALYNGSGILLGSSTTSPYNYVYSNLLVGTYTFYAIATDVSGVSTTSSAITITVTGPPVPVVAITSPANNSTFTPGSNLTVTAAASETNGSISKISIYYNGSNLLGSGSTSPYTYSTNNVPAGTYALTAVATDANGVSTTSSTTTVTFTNSSVAPSITAQPASITVTAPAAATFSVSATGTPAPTYQWMQSVNGAIFTNISGATNSSYTTGATSTSNSGIKYECVVTNSVGYLISNAATLTVTAPALPVVAITSPTSGSSFTAGNTINITASASETNGTISSVSFYNGSTLLGTDTSSPYNYTWSNVSAGSYTLTAKTIDANGVSVTSSAITITVTAASSSPVVTITSPANGSSSTAGKTISITASASETNGTISSVSFYNGSTLLGTDTSSPYSYSWTNASAGTYTLTAKATDVKGVSVTSSAITITVTPASSSPVVTITSPANGSTFKLNSVVTLTATASETNGSIANVKYYDLNGTNLVSTQTTAPYKFTATPAAGSYTIIAVATDANGDTTTSSPVTFTVLASTIPPSITTQPISATVTAPATATFSVVATGTPAPTYQWMQEISGASSYTAISGATSSSYTTPATVSTNNGTQYECVVSNSAGHVTSAAATLTVSSAWW